MELIIRRNELTFDVLDGIAAPDYDADTIKTTFDLGDPVRMRICLKIDTAAGDTRTEFGRKLTPLYQQWSCVCNRRFHFPKTL